MPVSESGRRGNPVMDDDVVATRQRPARHLDPGRTFT